MDQIEAIYGSEVADELLPILATEPERVHGYACTGCGRIIFQLDNEDDETFYQYEFEGKPGPCNGGLMPMSPAQIKYILAPTVH